MDEFRTVAALLLFCISAYLLCNLVMAGFDGYVLLGVIGFYLASLLVLPKRRDADRSFDLADTLDLIISFRTGYWREFCVQSRLMIVMVLIPINHQLLLFLWLKISRIGSSGCNR